MSTNTGPESGKDGQPSDRLLKYLSDQRSHFQNYHNHKENCAWAALVVSVTLALFVLTNTQNWHGCLNEAATIFFLGVVVAETVFITEQFRLRAFAADALSAFQTLQAIALGGKQPVDSGWDFTLTEEKSDKQFSSIWCRTVKYFRQLKVFVLHGNNSLTSGEDYSIAATTDLPAFAWKMIRARSNHGQVFRIRMELLVLFLLSLVNLLAVFRLLEAARH